LAPEARDALRQLVVDWTSGDLSVYGEVSWGATAIFVVRGALASRGLFALNRAGALELYFGYWDEQRYKNIGPLQAAIRDDFIALAEQLFGAFFRKATPCLSQRSSGQMEPQP
jgi:hypothetical protein